MSSNNLSIEYSGSLNISSELLCNKETQTSLANITDSFNLIKGPSHPLPKGIGRTNVKVPVSSKLVECKILKDLSESKSPALETESFIKDILNTNSSVSIDELKESPASLNFCKEVTLSHIETHLKDCDDQVESIEELIQDALEDNPDYQSGFEVDEGKTNIKEQVSGTFIKEMDTIQNLDPKEKMPNKASEGMETDSICKSAPANINFVKKDSRSDEINVSEDITYGFNNNEELNSSTSRGKTITVIGIKEPENPDGEPTFYAIDQANVNPSHNAQTETGSSLNSLRDLLNNSGEQIVKFTEACKGFAGNLISNPDEKMNTIKKTCMDYADKFYNTSKEAVTMLTSESAKFLSKSNTDISNDPQDDPNEGQPTQRIQNLNADSISSFLFKTAENKSVNDDTPIDNTISSTSKLTEVIPAVTVSFNKLKEDLVSAKFEKSSPYDTTLSQNEATSKPPDKSESRMPTVSAIDHPPDPPAAANVFDIIKSKIFSIFGDGGESSNEPESQEPQNDDEEDPFERFMEQ